MRIDANKVKMSIVNTEFYEFYSSTIGGLLYIDSLSELYISGCTFEWLNAPTAGRLVYYDGSVNFALKVYSSNINCNAATYN